MSLARTTNPYQAFDSIIFWLPAQENLHARQAPGKAHVAPTRGTRAVLGEISQNVTARRQPLRASKQVCGLQNLLRA